MKKPHLDIAKQLWASWVKPHDLVIDATLGNGQDALFLSRLHARVVGLDIQAQALEKASLLLKGFQVELLHRSHEDLEQLELKEPPRLIVFNLGYLPGGDKSITTKKETTMKALQGACRLLSTEGALSVMCYPGHKAGKEEEEAILSWGKTLDYKTWQVCHYQWINRPLSPHLLWIARSNAHLPLDCNGPK